MLLRNARESDFMRCVLLSRKAWPDFRERESIYHLFCRFFPSTSLVMEEENGTMLGFIFGFLSQVDSHEAYIHLVVVEPRVQRQGIGQQLYQAFFETVAGKGARSIRLIVNPDNAASLSFHRKLGFHADLTGIPIDMDGVLAVQDYNGPGLHMVPFTRDLES